MLSAIAEAPTDTASPTLLDWGNSYLDHCERRLSPKTMEEKTAAFKRLVGMFGKGFLVEKIGHREVLRFLSEQNDRRSGNGANRDRKNLAAAWKWARKYVSGFPRGDNLFQEAERCPEKREPRYVPPEKDFWKVCNQSAAQDRVMLLAFLHLGARKGEIFGLKVDDLDFENRTVRLWTNKREGGNRECDLVPMTETLAKAFKIWLEASNIKSEYVFVNQDITHFSQEHYGKPFSSRQHWLAKACERVGVKPFTWHSIRHLSATILYREGQTISTIQRILRHKSPTTTNRYLQRLGLDETRDALTAVMDKKRATN